MGTPFPSSSDTDIWNAIETYQPGQAYPAGRLGQIVRDSDPGGVNVPLAIKYVSAESAKYYRQGLASQFNISTALGYTWGAGTYVAPLAYPTSSAIFGRLGVVAKFDPSGWKVFDAVDPRNQDLYLAWTWRQALWYRPSMLTAGSARYNQRLRNRFRSRFKIDCVLFPPDQVNREYTKPTDVWMCVTDWKNPNTIKESGGSDKFKVPKACVLVDEEFYDYDGGIKRGAHLNPRGRAMTDDTVVARKIARRYFSRKHYWVRVKS